MRLLLDTNILIPLEPAAAEDITSNSSAAATIVRTSNSFGWRILVHPDQVFDIDQDRDEFRKQVRKHALAKYVSIEGLLHPSPKIQEVFNHPTRGSNSWVDMQLVNAVDRDSVDFLVTEDKQLQARARSLGFASRVLGLFEFLELASPFSALPNSQSPIVEVMKCQAIDMSDDFFVSLRADYGSGFDSWLQKCRRENRDALIIKHSGRLVALAILKIKGDLTLDPPPRVKICTFKVSDVHAGFRLGEALLFEIFRYAAQKNISSCFVTVLQKHEPLVILLKKFGFYEVNGRTSIGELVLKKDFKFFHRSNLAVQGYDDFIRFGPFTLDPTAKSYIFPIWPAFLEQFFPEIKKQLSLIEEFEPVSNAIRKAYVTSSDQHLPQPGDIIWFYRTTVDQAVTHVAVVEASYKFTDPYEAMKVIGGRTVF